MPNPVFSRRRRGAAFSSLVLAFGTAAADDFVAPYVPTVEEDVELMLELARVDADDYVIDLGSGDGRILIAAARRGAAGHGVELDPELVALSRENAREAGVEDRVAFVHGSVFDAEIDAATVVALYLFPEANLELRPTLLSALRPGTRIVSNSFGMGDWHPDVHDMSARSSGGILLWIVPAPIDGRWSLEIDDGARYSLAVRQQYQEIEIRLSGAGRALAVDAPTLVGDRIRFGGASTDTRYLFDGRVDGDGMRGFVQIVGDGGEAIVGWRATRQQSPYQ